MNLSTLYRQKLACLLALAAFTVVSVGCDEDPADPDDKADGGEAGSGGTGGKSGTGGTGGKSGTGGSGEGGTGGEDEDSGVKEDSGTPVEPCDPADKEVNVTADIDSDTTWDCGTYILKDLILVKGDSTLTIAPGVLVLGDTATTDPTSALIVTRGSKLHAVGTKEEPITFTSVLPAGTRTPGQWGGVVLLGKAKINTGAAIAGGGGNENNIEGLDATLATSKYGGNDDTHDCGELKYVRIQFAGFMLTMNKELNGLTLGACGSDTKLSYIQVHRGSDDGMEFFGGTVGMDHVLLSGNSDDGLDWDFGWTGKVQFLIVHQATNDGDNGFEGASLNGNELQAPRSNPTIYNTTMIGNPAKVGLTLKEGTLGTYRNFIVQNFVTGVDVVASAGMADPAAEWPTMLSIEDSVFFNITNVGDPDTALDDDSGFSEDTKVKEAGRSNVTTVDPMIADISITAPDYKPASVMLTGKATPPAGFVTSATYAGAVDPAGSDWTSGWTEFPAD